MNFSISAGSGILFLITIITMLAPQITAGIKCYQCNSRSNASCVDADNLDAFLVDCETQPKPYGVTKNATMCRKISDNLHYEKHVVRSCAYEGEVDANPKKCRRRQVAERFKQVWCTCNDKDGCNSASFLRLSVALSVFLPTVLFVLLIWRINAGCYFIIPCK